MGKSVEELVFSAIINISAGIRNRLLIILPGHGPKQFCNLIAKRVRSVELQVVAVSASTLDNSL
jgi:hypothetical protein